MKMGTFKFLLFITIFVSFCGFGHAKDQATKSPIYDSTILQSGRFNAALSGLTEIDFSEVRHRLLEMQADITNYPEEQQAQYWYYLAASGWKLGLPSDEVIPYIESALSFSDSIKGEELFHILMNAKDMARDYVHFHHVIKYINRIKQLVGERPDTQATLTVTPVDADYAIAHYEIGENKKAIDYLTRIISLTEMAGDKPVRYWFQVLSAAQEQIGDTDGAIKTLKKLIVIYPHRNSIEYLEVLEGTLANTMSN
jgi:tetratricopeptide (TPR) repeat protein